MLAWLFLHSRKLADALLDNILVLPANLVAQTANRAILPAGLQTEDAKSLGHDHLLHLVIRGRDAFEDLQSLHGGCAAGRLVGNHAAYRLVEDSGGGSEVEGTCRRQNLSRQGIAAGGIDLPPRVGLYRVILRR